MSPARLWLGDRYHSNVWAAHPFSAHCSSSAMVASDGNHVHILSMGGTIDKDYPRLTAGYAFEYGHESAASRILKTHPNLGISFDVTSVCRKDSLDMSDHDRDLLLDAMCKIMARWHQNSHHARIVVTHGTDTMIQTAQYVQKRISDNAVIAFTGATKPERFIDSDASFNLGCAIAATSVCSAGAVVICMNGNVVPAGKCIRDEKSGLFIAQTETK
jgi:L-asparaginase